MDVARPGELRGHVLRLLHRSGTRIDACCGHRRQSAGLLARLPREFRGRGTRRRLLVATSSGGASRSAREPPGSCGGASATSSVTSLAGRCGSPTTSSLTRPSRLISTSTCFPLHAAPERAGGWCGPGWTIFEPLRCPAASCRRQRRTRTPSRSSRRWGSDAEANPSESQANGHVTEPERISRRWCKRWADAPSGRRCELRVWMHPKRNAVGDRHESTTWRVGRSRAFLADRR